MKKFFGEFKKFIAQGNVIDLAVGVIIGGAFQKIVTSVVNDLVMPLIGLITKGSDFASKFVALDGGTYATFYGGRLLLTVDVDAVAKCQSYNTEMTSLVVNHRAHETFYLKPNA